MRLMDGPDTNLNKTLWIIDEAELEKDPLYTEHFNDIVSLAKDFFGFTPFELEETTGNYMPRPELEALTIASILYQIGLDDQKFHRRGFDFCLLYQFFLVRLPPILVVTTMSLFIGKIKSS